MEGKRARLAVTWAGPYADLIQAGLAGLAIFLFPDFGLNPFLFQFAVVTYLGVLVNLNPLLELDGYFLLMDGLEIPMLRRKSLDFVRTGLWAKFKVLPASGKRASAWLGEFSREERIFALFGILSAFWTIFSLVQALTYWQSRMTSAAVSLFMSSSGAGRVALLVVGGLLGLALVIYFVYALIGLGRRGLFLAGKAGLFATPWRKAAWAWGLALAVGAAGAFYPLLAPLAALGALTLWICFAACNARDYGGSRFARVFGLVSASGVLFWLAEANRLVAGLQFAWLSFAPAAAALLLTAAGLVLMVGASLKRLQPIEKTILLTGMLASSVWAIQALLSGGALISVTMGAASLFTIILLLPTLVDYWGTSTSPSATTMGLGLLALLGAALFDLSFLWAYLFMAAGLGLQQAAFRERVTLPNTSDGISLEQHDHELLEQSFRWVASGLYTHLLEISGKRQAQALQEQFNEYIQASGWHLRATGDQVEDILPAEWSLRQSGDLYAAALTLLLDMMAVPMGNHLTDRALQRVYDTMPWNVREIAAQYLFPEVKRAQALSQRFHADQTTYRALLRRIPLFAPLSQDEIDQLCLGLQVEKFSPRQVIIRQGERGDKFYIVTRGHVEVEQRNPQGMSEIVNHKDRGQYFGELALLNDTKRNATCRAVMPTEVLSLKRTDFDRFVRVCFDLRDKLESSISRAYLLRQIPFFTDLDEQQLHLIGAQMQPESCPAGTVIIRQGEPGEVFYVIESGQVEIRVTTSDGERVVDERGPGEYFGEIALVLNTHRTATVRAMAPTRLLALHKTDFDQLVVPQLYNSRLLEQEVSRRMLTLRRAAQG
jgi:putative peptide zinc metalloprotease protein